MPARKMRQTIQGLIDFGVFVAYEYHNRYGQSVLVWGPDGNMVRMSLGSATMYVRQMDRELNEEEWRWVCGEY